MKKVKPQNQDLTINEDYYINEEGLLVFTEVYHLKRGYCCNSGCKHCPFENKEQDSDE